MKMKKAILLLIIFISVLSKAQVFDSTYFATNNYITITSCNIYPCIKKSALPTIADTINMENVLDYGAVGNGVTRDDAALEDAFNAADANPSSMGVYLPAGKTFLVGSTRDIILSHNMVVWAYGSTIKMANLTRYTFLSLEATVGNYNYNVLWLGGTWDGNQYNQTWPGNPHGGVYDGDFVEAHGRLLGIKFAKFALTKDVTVINTVMDGIAMEANRIAMIDNCDASNGAPFTYGDVGDQGTYFKCTRTNSKWFYVNNSTTDGGSIGIHYSTVTGQPQDSSISVIYNCHLNNNYSGALHFEDCKKVFLYKCVITGDTTEAYKHAAHFSNQTVIASIRNSTFRNIRVNFNQATNLELAMIDQCIFSTTQPLLTMFLDGRPDLSTRNTFTGICANQQTEVKWSKENTYTNFGDLAISTALIVDSCSFTNGVRPASFASGTRFTGNTMTNVSNPNSNVSHIPADELPFTSWIKIFTTAGVYKGIIRCQ